MKAGVVLNSSMAKRLIAKGVVACTTVRKALVDGTVVVTLGTTNALVAEEILGEPIDRGAFAAGFIDDQWNVNDRLGELGEIVVRKGKRIDIDPKDLCNSLGNGDVVIKGGNALDRRGMVGVLMGASNGGTVGRYLSLALARGVDIIIPISLQKMVCSSISSIARQLGSGRIELCMGIPCGMQLLPGQVITEIDALEMLFPVEVMQVAAGGVGKGKGSISLLIEGEDTPVRAAFDLVSSLRNEREIKLKGNV